MNEVIQTYSWLPSARGIIEGLVVTAIVGLGGYIYRRYRIQGKKLKEYQKAIDDQIAKAESLMEGGLDKEAEGVWTTAINIRGVPCIVEV